MKVLFIGWSKIPHSYAIVNVFQIIHLVKNYPEIKLYMEEYPYFNPDWNNKTNLRIYPEEYYKILDSIEIYKDEKVDLVYNITYPYDVSIPDVPKIVFYTAEFSVLTSSYFTGVLHDDLNNRLQDKDLYFHTPSEWSFRGLAHTKNKCITHGVDTNIFKKTSARTKIRNFYGIKDTDTLLGNMGAMTRNKGILLILEALKILVIDLKQTQYKLLLKGTGDLYKTRDFMDIYIKELRIPEVLLEKHIIFIEDTLTFSALNNLYNALDLYLSPYFAEGFNLQPLECLSTGTTVLLPETGSTVDYTSKIIKVSPESLVLIPSNVVKNSMGFQNEINIQDLLNGILNYSEPTKHYDALRNVVQKELSWDYVSHELVSYFKEILIL
jgi:glycosyltransferase involved in cell wall biosynthesis